MSLYFQVIPSLSCPVYNTSVVLYICITLVTFSFACRYRYYTETRGDIFMPRGEAEGQKYINPSFCVIPDIHTTGKVCSYFTVHSSEYSN